LVRRSIEAVNTRNWAVLDELMVPDYVDHKTKPGREGYMESLISAANAFPDAQWAIEDIIGEGDKVVVRLTFSGTHRGEFMGVAPTNKRVTTTAIFIQRIVSGKLVEEWSNADLLGFFQQLGVIPSLTLGRE